jgi:cytochrome c biogenesis factor
VGPTHSLARIVLLTPVLLIPIFAHLSLLSSISSLFFFDYLFACLYIAFLLLFSFAFVTVAGDLQISYRHQHTLIDIVIFFLLESLTSLHRSTLAGSR